MLLQLIPLADAQIRKWCKQGLETQTYVEFPRPDGVPDLALKQFPVQCYLMTGTLTAGSPAVTGLTSAFPGVTANSLTAGTPAVIGGAAPTSVQAIPNNTTVAAVNSATSVTLSQNATLSGLFPVVFGLALWLDSRGFYGGGQNAFPAESQLYFGSDYALQLDRPDGTSRKALVKRVGGVTAGGGWPGWGAFGPWGGGQGSLTAALPPCWPKGQYGQIRAVYTAGWGVGAPDARGPLPPGTTLPPELTWACNMLTGWARTVAPVGVPLESETFRKGVADAMFGALQSNDPALGNLVSSLRPFRDYSA